jgi:hypothetical protein
MAHLKALKQGKHSSFTHDKSQNSQIINQTIRTPMPSTKVPQLFKLSLTSLHININKLSLMIFNSHRIPQLAHFGVDVLYSFRRCFFWNSELALSILTLLIVLLTFGQKMSRYVVVQFFSELCKRKTTGTEPRFDKL